MLAASLVAGTGFAQAEMTPKKVVPPTVTTPAAVQYPETAIAERHFADVEVVLPSGAEVEVVLPSGVEVEVVPPPGAVVDVVPPPGAGHAVGAGAPIFVVLLSVFLTVEPPNTAQ